MGKKVIVKMTASKKLQVKKREVGRQIGVRRCLAVFFIVFPGYLISFFSYVP
jgi:hypothetical protein